ncbi:tripartite tricarboxylate transporter TctB family protein [Aureimonas altamirensis]|uniref:tripartite tricarboxylate transporter TctB family protein n=1 Tax=Aureimonas altamirensis TaxID=370622 RepID=UPI0020368708|nr:tripartite tricarboxylate transporter TctB family protein [Aureimonas altamirensis]MCM2502637.1 tripartite tricarboxylate transporter TctB family protein [Aureimonas altamirensis]
MPTIRAGKDFWAGVLYAAFGALALVVARDYPVGTTARMGPGYFPAMLGTVLAVFGLAAIVRSLLRDGERVGKLAWMPMGLVTTGVVAFAWLLPRLGLPLSLVFLLLVPASASGHFRLGLKPLLLMAILISFCTLLFVEALGVPMPLVGNWVKG